MGQLASSLALTGSRLLPQSRNFSPWQKLGEVSKRFDMFNRGGGGEKVQFAKKTLLWVKIDVGEEREDGTHQPVIKACLWSRSGREKQKDLPERVKWQANFIYSNVFFSCLFFVRLPFFPSLPFQSQLNFYLSPFESIRNRLISYLFLFLFVWSMPNVCR